MKKVIIDRTNWLRGEGSDSSCLLRTEDQKQCCFGMALEQFGIPRDMLPGHLTPGSLLCAAPEVPDGLQWTVDVNSFRKNTLAAYDLMGANDDPDLSDTTRERHVAEGFAKHNIEVEFIN